mmetsp:Transcript_15491/g.39899  ORF Transcript_15491/g.39899 Transcript_15491/m.39899 type:complete len:133 (+) Transcript_15491:93-491(+)
MAEKARREIKMAEVEKHNTEKDCWLCVHDLILDLPKDFLEEHPGGPDVITCLAGRDCTEDFEDISHSDSAREWASKYIIGYKEGAEEEAKTKVMPKNSEVAGRGGGGGGMGPLLPAIVVVILAALAYVIFKK